MPSFDHLARSSTKLDDGALRHLQRLVGSWALLCDLSYSDLLLYVASESNPTEFLTLGHRRSVTGPTVHPRDPVGAIVTSAHQPLIATTMSEGRLLEGAIPVAGLVHPLAGDDEVVEEAMAPPGVNSRLFGEYVPVGHQGEVIAVMARHSDPGLMRQTGSLEHTYRNVWHRLVEMVMSGDYPFADEEREGELREPRVGDGTVLLDRERRIEFASPNAVSALHRLGVGQNLSGRTLSDVGIEEGAVRRAFTSRRSTITELVIDDQVNVVVRCHPLVSAGRVTGALLLMRDISELRSRDRLLLSREVTIREINHRVKNNLQTIQALLRLQARRSASDDARTAIEQSARRIGAIAIVHETLSADVADEVEFDRVVARILSMVQEGSSAPERPLSVEVVGKLGVLPGDVAMPLAVILTELVQNAIDHAVADARGSEPGLVTVELASGSRELVLRVVDSGPGVADGFSLDRDAGLGLTIVRTFVVQDLGGSISIGARGDGETGCVVEVKVPAKREGLPLG